MVSYLESSKWQPPPFGHWFENQKYLGSVKISDVILLGIIEADNAEDRQLTDKSNSLADSSPASSHPPSVR